MKKIKMSATLRRTGILLVLFVSVFWKVATANAAVITGKVQVIYTMNYANAQDQSANVALFRIADGPAAGNPPCSKLGEWAFSLKDPSGRAMFAQLLHAQSSGLDVTVVGDGTCTSWSDRERPLYIFVIYP